MRSRRDSVRLVSQWPASFKQNCELSASVLARHILDTTPIVASPAPH
jgi:hypothetical protein